MKTLLIFLVLTLSCFLHLSTAAPVGVDALFEESCCENVTTVVIPLKRVTQFKDTPKDCSIQAIIVTAVCGNRFCVDPNTSWAKRLKKTWRPSLVEPSKAHCPKKP